MSSDYFDKDSLIGFDETAARNAAISEQFYGSEFSVRMTRLKRDFINIKYGLKPTTIKNPVFQSQIENKPLSTACDNEDFESSQVGTILTQNQI